MKRKIIEIDEELCTGCGNCITGCSEGALALIDGKARLVKENYCDGFGDCIGTCPTGALTIVEREADDFDLEAVKEHLFETQGEEAVQKMETAQARHESKHQSHGHHYHSGCPGSLMRIFEDKPTENKTAGDSEFPMQPSELRQWPVHFRLVSPNVPFFKNKELVLMSTCGPIANANIHQEFIKDRSVIVGCPKLDDTSDYIPKLAQILAEPTIPKVIIARMEVPCCGGLTMIVNQAVRMSGRTDLCVEEVIFSLNGKTKAVNMLQ